MTTSTLLATHAPSTPLKEGDRLYRTTLWGSLSSCRGSTALLQAVPTLPSWKCTSRAIPSSPPPANCRRARQHPSEVLRHSIPWQAQATPLSLPSKHTTRRSKQPRTATPIRCRWLRLQPPASERLSQWPSQRKVMARRRRMLRRQAPSARRAPIRAKT